MQKSPILVTLPENAQYNTLYYFHSHLKTTVKLHITVFSEVTDTEYVCFTFLLHMLFAILICSQHCAKEKNIYNKHKLTLGRSVHNCKQYCSTYWN